MKYKYIMYIYKSVWFVLTVTVHILEYNVYRLPSTYHSTHSSLVGTITRLDTTLCNKFYWLTYSVLQRG